MSLIEFTSVRNVNTRVNGKAAISIFHMSHAARSYGSRPSLQMKKKKAQLFRGDMKYPLVLLIKAIIKKDK